MGSGPGTGSGGRGGGSAARGLALAEASPAQGLASAEASPAQERPPVDVNDEGDIELAPLDFEEAVAAVEDQVVTKPEAARNLESLPEPGTPESGARLAAEFGIPITYMPAEQMRLIYGRTYSGFWDGRGIVINSTTYPNAKVAARVNKQMASTGWSASSHPDALVHHEIGHALHERSLRQGYGVRMRGAGTRGMRYEAQRSKVLNKRLAKIIKREVSGYAANNRLEIVAEMYSGLRGGKTYSPRLMQYYKALGGPSV
jgi:hypothetical protein